jgi:ACS family hexuronate transporter-like MFS transporter
MVGSVIAQPLIAFLVIAYGWHAAFLAPSAAGIVWVLLWWRCYRTPPAPPVEAAAPSNRALLRVPETWALMGCRMLVGPVVQFYIFWLPEYLYRQHGFSLKEIGMFAWMPFLFGDIGSVAGGWVAGRLIQAGYPVRATRQITMGLGAAFCLLSLAVAASSSSFSAMAFICAVLFGHTFLSANMFAAISDVFPDHAVGRVTALTGIAGGISGFSFPILAGWLIDRISYVPVFTLAAVMPVLGCLVLFAVLRRLPQT